MVLGQCYFDHKVTLLLLGEFGCYSSVIFVENLDCLHPLFFRLAIAFECVANMLSFGFFCR